MMVHTANALTVDRQYGAVLEGRWVPAPRFVLRRSRILPLVERLALGRVVEMGCGSGALLRELALRGHDCTGVETSPQALEVACDMLADLNNARVQSAPDPDWRGAVDTLLSFEVLEHIEDDEAALAEWAGWLKPGGTAILSVPAHMAMWSPRDEWAGHYRRYSRAQFAALAAGAGLEVERIECLGFPLANVTHWLGNLSVRGQAYAGGGTSRAEGTAASGTDRSTLVKYFGLQRSLPGRAIMGTASLLQNAFLDTDLGDSFLLLARKR